MNSRTPENLTGGLDFNPAKRRIRLVETPQGSFVTPLRSVEIKVESPPEKPRRRENWTNRGFVETRQHIDPLTNRETIENIDMPPFDPQNPSLQERMIMKGIRIGFDRHRLVRDLGQGERAKPARADDVFLEWLQNFQHIVPTAELQQHLNRQRNIQYPPFATSRQLQAITDARNTSPWSPIPNLARADDSYLDRQRLEFYTGNTGLWKSLHRASQRQGYRMLAIKRLRFKTDSRLPSLETGSMALSPSGFTHQQDFPLQAVAPAPAESIQIEAGNGSIDLLEIPVHNAAGQVRIWICFRIIKSFSGSRERAIPRYGGPEHQELTIVFACPISQVLKLNESTNKAGEAQAGPRPRQIWVANPNGKRRKIDFFDCGRNAPLHLSFVFSKDGVPSFETWLSGPGPSWLERMNQPEIQAMVHDWERIKYAMSKFECTVEAVSAAGRWIKFEGLSAH